MNLSWINELPGALVEFELSSLSSSMLPSIKTSLLLKDFLIEKKSIIPEAVVNWIAFPCAPWTFPCPGEWQTIMKIILK